MNGRRSGDTAKPKRRRGPLWARLCAVLGALLMMTSGGLIIATEVLAARYEGAVAHDDLFGDGENVQPVADITGPLNILLVGVDTRVSRPDEVPRGDAVLILHVPASMDQGYLFSLPRDLLVDIPPFEKSGYPGGHTKLTHAMMEGSTSPDGSGKPSVAQGFELLSKTVSNYTGIERFDAGAIINFEGFKKVVDAMGGVDMYLDMDVTSIHMRPDGKHRAINPYGGGDGPSGYTGPQKQYKKGHAHLEGWEALDYARQRYLEGGDYTRQRHQQQFIKAMIKQATSKDVVSNPFKVDEVLRAAGQSLVFSGRGHRIMDFGIALRGLRSESITMLKLPGGGVGVGSGYQGEQLEPIAQEFFAAIRAGTADQFILAHPELINKTK